MVNNLPDYIEICNFNWTKTVKGEIPDTVLTLGITRRS